jgi:ubiquitin carboxyl-terminal hydrolase 4/11
LNSNAQILWLINVDSSVTKRQDRGIVTHAAYLLFYRRRSTNPLGSPELQRIVERAMNGATPDSDSGESRASSPDLHDSKSGNGRALGGLYPSGSSSALVGPVAARPHLGVGSVGAEQLRKTDGVDSVFARLDEEDDEDMGPPLLHVDHLPAYSEVDEAIDMEQDDDTEYDLTPHKIHNPVPQPAWSFNNLNGEETAAYDDDQASNVAADGDDEDDEFSPPNAKLTTDFGDEETQDGAFVHDGRRWTTKQVEESRRPSSPATLATAAAAAVAAPDEEEDVMDSVEH